MKDKIRQISSGRLMRNFVSVGFIQGLGMLLPLLTIPYLLSVLGASGFALINLALAVVTFFVVLTDYGFNLMGTRLVALHQDDKARLNRIFSNMLYAQFLLSLLAVLLFALIVAAVPSYRENFLFFGATFGVVIGSTLLPTWYFQGREKFNQLHLINLAYRSLYTIGIFVLVNEKSDLLKVPLLNSATHIAGGLAALLWAMGHYGLRFGPWRWKEIFALLREGWNLFVSAASVTSLTQLPIIVLAFFVSSTVVGFYAFAEKILLLFRVLIQLLSSILYPRVVKASKTSFNAVKGLVKKVQSFGAVALAGVAVFLFFTPELLKTYLPQYYNPALEAILKIWALLPLAIFLKITAQQILLAYDHTRAFARSMLAGAGINAALLLILSAWLGYSGTALAVLLTEVFLIFALQSRSRKLAPK